MADTPIVTPGVVIVGMHCIALELRHFDEVWHGLLEYICSICIRCSSTRSCRG